MLHPWHGVGVGEQAPEVVTAIIEVPRGSNIKYELDKASGLLKVDRILYSAIIRPITGLFRRVTATTTIRWIFWCWGRNLFCRFPFCAPNRLA